MLSTRVRRRFNDASVSRNLNDRDLTSRDIDLFLLPCSFQTFERDTEHEEKAEEEGQRSPMLAQILPCGTQHYGIHNVVNKGLRSHNCLTLASEFLSKRDNSISDLENLVHHPP